MSESRFSLPFQEHVRIAPFTSMKTGGTVRYLFRPQAEQELATLLGELHAQHIPFYVIGNASNLLFPDEGFDGAVVLTAAMREMRVNDGCITASCGVSLSALASFAANNGLGGLSFAYGIPGTVGGGVYMNAGAYGGQMSDVCTEVLCADESGALVRLSGEALQFGYRHSALQERPLYLLHAVFSCPKADSADCKAEMERNMAARVSKQPLEFPSCGSAFKRPVGHFAGALIEQTGLKGFTIGGAQVSEKHAGFIINRGGATSDDVKAVIQAVQERVFAATGIQLEPEIRIL